MNELVDLAIAPIPIIITIISVVIGHWINTFDVLYVNVIYIYLVAIYLPILLGAIISTHYTISYYKRAGLWKNE